MNDCFNSSSSFTVGTDELTLCAVVNSFSEAINELSNLDEDNVKLIQDITSKMEVAPKQ